MRYDLSYNTSQRFFYYFCSHKNHKVLALTTHRNAMKQVLRDQLRGMTVAEKVEMVFWAALLVVLPFSWRLSIWASTALLAYGIVKTIACRKGRATQPLAVKLTLLMPILLFVVLLVSMTYSDNLASGWEKLVRRLSLVTFPAYLLLASPAWMSPARLRLLFRLFTLSCTGFFMFYLGYRFCPVLLGQAGLASLFVHGFLVEHHTYAALYFLLALSFVYHELVHFRATLATSERCLLAFAALCMVLFLVFISSRSGIVCLLMLTAVALFNTTFRRRRYLAGIGLTLLAAGLFLGTVSLLNDSQRRLTHTIAETATKGQQDVRFDILRVSAEAIGEHWLAGVGIGDRDSVLLATHRDRAQRGLPARGAGLNSHNEYLDNWLSAGLPGLLACLLLFAVPSVAFRRHRPYNGPLLALMLITSVTSVFESMMGRQMGLLFFIAFYCLLTTYAAWPADEARVGPADSPRQLP